MRASGKVFLNQEHFPKVKEGGILSSLSPLPGKVFLNPVSGNPLPQRLSRPLFGGVLELLFFAYE